MMNRIVIVKLSILFGLLLALTKGVDPNVITASYPIIMEVGRTLDISRTNYTKKLDDKE